jgi:RNA polymerase sigma factor (sigma-70 family)
LEASTLQAPAVRARSGASIGISLLRLRSDEQLVALFRAGNDDAFRAIHDRYRQRLFAYTRQMLPRRQDAEDALQDVFVRAYAGLRASDRHVALRAWLYRVAHNRCVDELRRPLVPPAEVFELISVPDQDPVAQADQRESLRRLIADVRRLPEQQRSALLMRELSGMSYAELAEALETTVPAVKSLLVRARMALALSIEARDAACADIREELVLAQDRRLRPNAMARRHMRDCQGCREFRHELRGVSRQLAALAPAIGPVGVAAKLLGFGFGGGAGGGAAMGSGTAAAGGATIGVAGSGGALASAGAIATGASHVATLIVATVVTAGGAVEIQHTIAAVPAHHHPARHTHARASAGASGAPTASSVLPAGYVVAAPNGPSADSVPVPVAPVLHPALSAPAPAMPVAPAKPVPSGRSAKPAHAPKAAPSATSTSTSATGDGTSSATSPSAPVAPAVAPSSATGAASTSSASTASSTSTGAATSTSTGESGSSASSEPPAAQASTGTAGSSSAGSAGAATSGSGTGQSGSAPTGQ